MPVDLGDGEVNIDGNLDNFQKSLAKTAKIGGKVFTAMGLAITAALGASAKAAQDFTKSMAEVNTLGVENLAALEQGVKDLSIQFGQDLGDSVQATYDIISAGIPEGSALDVLAASAEAAVAGVSDVSTAVDLSTSVLNAFGLEAGEVTTVFDAAFGAIKAGKTTMDELAGSVGRVAPLFNAAGLNAQEMFASIAALTKGGIKTTEAVSGLKAALTGVIKPTTEATQLANQLGIEFNTEALQAQGLVGFLQGVAEATGGNIDQMGQLFGSIEGLNAVLALTGPQAKSLEETFKDLTENTGQSREAFDRFIEANPGFVFEQTKAQVKVLAIELGQSLLPALIELVKMVKPWIESLIGIVQAHPKATAAIVTVTAAVGALMLAIGPVLIALGSISTMFAGAGGVAAAAGAATGAIGLLGAALGPAAIVAVLAGAGVAIWLVIEALGELRASTKRNEELQRSATGTNKILIETLQEEGVRITEVEIAGLDQAEMWALLKERLTEAEQAQGREIDSMNGVMEATEESTGSIQRQEQEWRFYVEGLDRGVIPALESTQGVLLDTIFLANELASFNFAGGGIPGQALASGGIVKSPIALVGERGPELASFPQGTRITPASETKRMLQQAGSGGGNTFSPTINVTVDQGAVGDPEQFAEEVNRALFPVWDRVMSDGGFSSG
jgi:TP901 family phage tail tape measure protein